MSSNEDFVEFSCPYLLYFPRNKPSNIVTVDSGQAGPVHRLNDSASPDMVIFRKTKEYNHRYNQYSGLDHKFY